VSLSADGSAKVSNYEYFAISDWSGLDSPSDDNIPYAGWLGLSRTVYNKEADRQYGDTLLMDAMVSSS